MPLGMEVGLGPGDFVLDRDPAAPTQKGGGALLPNFRPMFIVAKRHGRRPQPRRPCRVRWGPSPLRKKGAEPPPQFSSHFYCGQTAGCTKMPLGMELGLSPGDFFRWGHSPLSKKGEKPPKFSAHVYCAQTAGCMTMPLGMEVGLSPGDFCSMGTKPPPPKKGGRAPNFRPIFIVAKRLDESRWHLAWRWALVQAALC